MKTNAPFAAILLAAVTVSAPDAVAASAAAATESTGSIIGRVRNIATGQYLNRARVAVRGTEQVVFTDEYGTFRIPNVRTGQVTLDVFYTDLDPQGVTVEVPAGGAVERNVDLTSAARYGATAGAVMRLDSFTVTSQRETDAEAIAANEQRFAPNIKNVLATDAFGDVFGSSAGDFLKFIPGLAVDYDNADVSTVSIRGIGAAMTGVLFDGAPIVTGSNTGPTRTVEMRTQALNNISRIDVTKVPTPSSPADSLGGSVNMISKSAFERSGRELRYGLNVSGNSNALEWRATPQPYRDRETIKYKPSFDFDFTMPVTRDFGFVFTGTHNQKYREQNISRNTWNAGGTATGASFSQPYLRQFTFTDAPRTTSVTVFSLKADWRVTPNSVLSAGGRWGRNIRAQTGFTNLIPNVGTNGTPTVAGGVPFSYGPDFTIGATGRGAVNLAGTWQYSYDDTFGTNAGYRFDNGKWRIETALNYSGSKTRLQSDSRGNFNNITTVLRSPARVTFRDITPERPWVIQAFDNSNREINLYDVANYRISTANIDERAHLLTSRNGTLDLRRRLDVFSFPSAVQAGGHRRIQTVDARRRLETFNFTGTDPSPAPYLYSVYVNQDAFLGFKNVPGLSPQKAWQAYQADPSLFTATPAQRVAAETARLNASEYVEETVSAAYLQAEARFLRNRLTVLTGVRFEQTDVEGQGLLFDPSAPFVRNADGTFARNAQGNRIRKPEAGAAGSLEELRLTRRERAFTAERTYDGYYPSLHLTYNVHENYIVRLAYAKTYGRPNFGEIIPSATIQEADLDATELNDPSVSRGNITVNNTGLRPWTADNYDLSLEYYSPQGGFFSTGVFEKQISDFFGTAVQVATAATLQELGLDSRYVGWNLTSQFNSGDARIRGVEFNLRHSLRALGGWGRHFTVFANATRLDLRGDPHASFQNFIPKTANAGFSFKWRRLTIMPRLNYRGLNKLIAQPAFGPDGFQYIKARRILDLSVSYQITPRLSVTGAINNILNDELTQMHYSSLTPAYARQSLNGEYGAAFSVGIRGSF